MKWYIKYCWVKLNIWVLTPLVKIENLYEKVENNEDNLKGKQRENIVNNKEMAELSRKLGEIDTQVPLEDTLDDIRLEIEFGPQDDGEDEN